MTRDEMIAAARYLQDRADASWPDGYDPVKVKAEATRLLRLFDQAARTPADSQALVEQLEEVKEAW